MPQTGAAPTSGPPLLTGTIWQVEDLDQGGVIDSSMLTLDFTEDGKVMGFTGCNRYFGAAIQDADRLSFPGIGSTRRACAPALMNQEQRFLTALEDSSSFAIDTDTWLVIYDAQGMERIRGIEVSADPTSQGRASPETDAQAEVVYDCGQTGAVGFVVVDPDTVELTVGNDMHVLKRARAASGARYSGRGIEFWSKGDEALLTVDDEQFSCKRR